MVISFVYLESIRFTNVWYHGSPISFCAVLIHNAASKPVFAFRGITSMSIFSFDITLLLVKIKGTQVLKDRELINTCNTVLGRRC
ncbi:hypothetical protein BJ165DRAFT_1517804 [Panaeolus papilionaceus]|nr:hypothetical protein BJ165DRAFT_1517804 [Panaeolus papilionaceus]